LEKRPPGGHIHVTPGQTPNLRLQPAELRGTQAIEKHPKPLVVTDLVVVINPSTRGFLRRQANARLAITL
ncbi:hypothetical protein, partial [Nonomuraea fuscirosea]|uniref:hypothetical protein n=1 Tax=Nonomuraea fuscirosea TaxID=1291556 RepID=UPI001C630F40